MWLLFISSVENRNYIQVSLRGDESRSHIYEGLEASGRQRHAHTSPSATLPLIYCVQNETSAETSIFFSPLPSSQTTRGCCLPAPRLFVCPFVLFVFEFDLLWLVLSLECLINRLSVCMSECVGLPICVFILLPVHPSVCL